MAVQTLERYPVITILLASLHSLLVYTLGAYILSGWGWIWVALYLAYCLGLEIRLLAGHCVDCHYYGKTCAFGKGRVAALFFKQGDPGRFARRPATWLSLVPDFLLFLVPLGSGVVLVAISFSWQVLAAVLLLFFASFLGSGMIRGTLACPFCKQREMGCPAERLFRSKS